MPQKFRTILSPHFDDAIFSAFSCLQESNLPIKIITICAGQPEGAELSSWDKKCGFDSGKIAAIKRAEEDLEVCKKLGVQHVHLDFIDQPYSGAKNIELMAKKIQPHLSEMGDILLPLGIGQNYDHLAVRDSLLDYLYTPEMNVTLYADVPYANSYSEWMPELFKKKNLRWKLAFQQVIQKGFILSAPEKKILSNDTIREKLNIASLYKSQIKPIQKSYPSLMSSSGPLSIETFWKVCSSLG
jgi:GlcNAc-PI de-N-acetylase